MFGADANGSEAHVVCPVFSTRAKDIVDGGEAETPSSFTERFFSLW